MTLDCQFVLVNPEDPHNIGAVARCLHNLGFPQSLRLVTPKTSICDDARARYMAHTAAVVLDSAQIFPTLEEALADVDVSVGTSTRHRQTIHRYLPLPDLAQALAAKQEHDLGRIGIVFGPESTGLTSADLKLC